MELNRRQNRLLLGFLLLSLLLHLLLLLLPKSLLLPRADRPEPVYVEVRPPQPRDRELDIPLREELQKPRQTPAKRLAERDQVVAKETAPEGKDTEDLQPKAARAPQPKPQSQPAPKTPPSPPVTPQQSKPTEAPPVPTGPDGAYRTAEPAATQPAPKPLPDLNQLTQISPQALASIERDWRQKYRKDITKGDTVWMDTEQDLLISFMRRFRSNIYGVWNYPVEARQREQQGACLLRITISREGRVEDVVLLESSGVRSLDDEAIRAVRKGAPYGPLPSAYPNEKLNIMAFFKYQLGSGRVRYGRDLY